MFEEEFEDLDSFEKFVKPPKTGKEPNMRKSDHQIRLARKNKEKAKQAILEEVEAAEE